MLHQRKDPIPNQDSIRIINRKDPILPPLSSKYPTVCKPFFMDTHSPNETEDDLHDYTYNARTEIDDELNKLNVKNY